MTYYFISLDPGNFKKFQSRISFLAQAIWLKDKEALNEVLESPPGEHCFFIQLTEPKGKMTEWAVEIRKVWQFARIIYVTKGLSPQHQKEHQLSFAGGDAYVGEDVDVDMLADILRGLKKKSGRSELTASATEMAPAAKGNMPEPEMEEIFSDLTALKKVLEHPLSKNMDALFKEVLQLGKNKGGGLEIPDLHMPPPTPTKSAPAGVNMSDKDQELSLDDLGELEIGGADLAPSAPQDDGLSLSLDDGDAGIDLQLGGDSDPVPSQPADDGLDLGGMEITMMPSGEDAEASEDGDEFGELSLGDEENLDEDGELLSIGDDAPDEDTIENIGELDLSAPAPTPEVTDGGLDLGEAGLDLGGDDLNLTDDAPTGLDLAGDVDLGAEELSADIGGGDEVGLEFGVDAGLDVTAGEGDISDDAKKKLMEIDAIMDQDASQVNITAPDLSSEPEVSLGAEEDLEINFSSPSASLDEPLVSDDLNLDSINFGSEEEAIATPVASAPAKASLALVEEAEEEEEVVEERPKKRKKEAAREPERDLAEDFREISGAYSGEMERTQATIANLRADRQELLNRIQQLEDEKVIHGRQQLTMRAELDERKIELSIIRKKLNEEISELKDRLKMQEERKLILEEKNRVLMVELDKAGQKNKIDLKKVQMRERELEQKLELLKSDAETQIKNRDLKILELKRKIDAMEFDMESISQQEKRSVESRFELEDKLDKAIKTLRTAISVLEDESDRGNALNALKKNIDV